MNPTPDDPRALVWECASCLFVGVVEEFVDPRHARCHMCPECQSSDVFSALEPKVFVPSLGSGRP